MSAVLAPTDKCIDAVRHKKGVHTIQFVLRDYQYVLRVIEIATDRCVREINTGWSESLGWCELRRLQISDNPQAA